MNTFFGDDLLDRRHMTKFFGIAHAPEARSRGIPNFGETATT